MGFFGRTSKTSGCVRIGVLATAAVVALACHYFDDDDSGSSFASPSQFEGTWQGTLWERSDSSSYDLVWQIDAESTISSVSIDTVDQGLTGTLKFSDPNPIEEFARFYDFELVDGSDVTQASGSFYIDDRFEHGLVIYSNGDLAVLQKTIVPRPGPFTHGELAEKMTGTRVLGVYVDWDVLAVIEEVGDWIIATEPEPGGGGDIPYRGRIGGTVEELDSGQQGEKTLKAGMGTDISGNFTLADFDPMGIWVGEDAPGDPEPLIVIMAFDRDFAGTVECDPNGFPDCFIGIWAPIKVCDADDYPECAFND
jgi:hypothetical protein